MRYQIIVLDNNDPPQIHHLAGFVDGPTADVAAERVARRADYWQDGTPTHIHGNPLYPLSDFGDKMTVAQFTEDVENGFFISYDGSGVYALETHQTHISVWTDEGRLRPAPFWATHVMWFNK